ncbi:MAG TPA: alpha-amylase family glycosyl hydrolase, partial [Planctomycetota bacterium]|nr:alpha-amylase family glycosyl hydrolase [Planctomycetota bacterium]
PGAASGAGPRSVVADLDAYDWEGDLPLERPFGRTVVYELHVRGFTRHASSGVRAELRGTYLGLVEKIPYLRELGVTAVELLPVFQFDAQDAPPALVNYWGYSPMSFFAPHVGYATRPDPLVALDEFRDMVKALHRAGIEVLLDVVFNHTAEGGAAGPSFCWKGLASRSYYLQDPETGRLLDFTGTGNTFNANHHVARRLILDSLVFWARDMHVDGFRFDLASILSRDERGAPMETPPVLWAIESEPALAGTKLIAEAWDLGGLYQVGSFVGDRWQEWNGRFRDDVRAFFRGDRGTAPRLAHRLLASPDLYAHKRREPEHTVNFVTCHDGFTLNDLVSYAVRHNWANGEQNRDGYAGEIAWNNGVEGPSDDPAVDAARLLQTKGLLAVTVLALGTPMLLAGDEFRRTQRGNSNAYCHDDDTSWIDWTLLERHRELFDFVRRLIRFRQERDVSWIDHGLCLSELLASADVRWHGTRLDHPDWGDDSHSLAFTATSPSGLTRVHTLLSAWSEPLEFELPRPGAWRRCLDTALPAPDDLVRA